MNSKEIYKEIKDNGYCICPGMIPLDEYKKSREEAINYFSEICNSKNSLPPALRGNVGAGMKDVVGYSSNKKWKIYRGCYFPWNQDNNKLRNTIALSRKISNFRNEMIDKKNDYGIKIDNNGFIQYTSLSLYPKNHGFLNKHYDGYAKKDFNKLIHFKIELTHKYLDYEKGGFYIWDRKGREIDLSAKIKPGDVIFFNGSNHHEVKPIKGNIGRIGLFEIPTHVSEYSRLSDYSSEGESKFIKAKRFLNNFLRHKILR